MCMFSGEAEELMCGETEEIYINFFCASVFSVF